MAEIRTEMESSGSKLKSIEDTVEALPSAADIAAEMEGSGSTLQSIEDKVDDVQDGVDDNPTAVENRQEMESTGHDLAVIKGKVQPLGVTGDSVHAVINNASRTQIAAAVWSRAVADITSGIGGHIKDKLDAIIEDTENIQDIDLAYPEISDAEIVLKRKSDGFVLARYNPIDRNRNHYIRGRVRTGMRLLDKEPPRPRKWKPGDMY